MVNRLIEPSAGTIRLEGVDVRGMEVTSLRRQIGYVIQQIGLFPHMTVAENIGVVPELLDWPKKRVEQRIDELLTLVDLPPEEYRRRYPAQLSGGQQQRVGVARGLAGDPKLLLMDEPFGAIDAITRAGLQNELLSLQRRLKKTVLFVTHDVEEALYLAHKIVVMREGRIVQYDSPLNILARPADEFVYQLVGADDIVRQLSLVRVESGMRPLPAAAEEIRLGSLPTISCDADLRSALSRLLRTGNETLLVHDDGTPVGLLTLDDIRSSAEARTPTLEQLDR
jgi:osmoprotectant transport system ATP-binding protein